MSNVKLDTLADVVRHLARTGQITRQDAAMRLALIDSGAPAIATAGIENCYVVDQTAGCYRLTE